MKYVIVGLLLSLGACEPAERKIARLNENDAIARLTFQMYQHRTESLMVASARAKTKSRRDSINRQIWVVSDSLSQAQNKLDLTNRELNLFMAGR